MDSGLKTIRGVVTDANGRTAEASVELYVLLTNPAVLTRGETYRVTYGSRFEHLITAPPTYDLELHPPDDIECSTSLAPGERCEHQFGFALVGAGVEARLFLYVSDAVEARRWQILLDGTTLAGRRDGAAGAAGGDPVDQAFDAVADSVGDKPGDRD